VSVSYILLAHNEVETIEGELRSIHEAVIRRLPGSELIVAEDGSVDGTRAAIERLRDALSLRIVGGEARKGYARATIDAVSAATQPFVFVSDGGFKHDAAEFWALWELRDSYDLVIGWKKERHDALYRRALTSGLNLALRMLFRVPLHDADSGFRLYNQRVVQEIIRPGLTFRGFVSAEVVLRSMAAGLRCGEVPITYRQRVGQSRGLPVRKIPRATLRLLLDLWRLKRLIARRAA